MKPNALSLIALTLSGSSVFAAPVEVKLGLANPVMISEGLSTTYLKVGLTGGEGSSRPSPVNLSIVLDRSGSMAGDKIQRAKEAARLLIDRLGPDDIVSIVAYDGVVEVIVPATKLTNKQTVLARIDGLQPNGSTALFAGVSTGLEEVRKFFDRTRVNRVILLSDGQANVGPSTPNELAQLGSYAVKTGISVSTIGLGLGYNEDLMTALARKSDGNHDFAAESHDLPRIFDVELKDVLAVVAQEVTVKVRLPEGVRAVRSLNRDAEIRGREVILSMNQLYANQEKFLLVELEVQPQAAGRVKEIAIVDVSYANIQAGGATERVSRNAMASFSRLKGEVERATDKEVMVAALEALATKQNELALALRDEGKVKEAQRVLLDNSASLKAAGAKWGSTKLDAYGDTNAEDAQQLDSSGWNLRRKMMRKQQYTNESQQLR